MVPHRAQAAGCFRPSTGIRGPHPDQRGKRNGRLRLSPNGLARNAVGQRLSPTTNCRRGMCVMTGPRCSVMTGVITVTDAGDTALAGGGTLVPVRRLFFPVSSVSVHPPGQTWCHRCIRPAPHCLESGCQNCKIWSPERSEWIRGTHGDDHGLLLTAKGWISSGFPPAGLVFKAARGPVWLSGREIHLLRASEVGDRVGAPALPPPASALSPMAVHSLFLCPCATCLLDRAREVTPTARLGGVSGWARDLTSDGDVEKTPVQSQPIDKL